MEKKRSCKNPSESKITWGELKQMIEDAGVRAEDEIDMIDISWGSKEQFTCTKDEDFGWQIKL